MVKPHKVREEFKTVNEMTDEQVQTEWDEAMKAYRLDHSSENAQKLRVAASRFIRKRPDVSGIGPFLGIMNGIAREHGQPLILRLSNWMISRSLKRDMPGWNDYWMVLWMVTEDQECVKEIHHRAKHLDKWPEVSRTAQWMVASVRQQDPAFDAAMRTVEQWCKECGKVAHA